MSQLIPARHNSLPGPGVCFPHQSPLSYNGQKKRPDQINYFTKKKTMLENNN